MIDGGRETIRASDDEDETAGGVALLLQPAGKLDAAVLVAVLVEEDNGVGGLKLTEYQFALHLFLLFLREILGVFQFGDGGDRERHVVGYALGIVVDAGSKVLVGGLAYEDEFGLHALMINPAAKPLGILSIVNYPLSIVPMIVPEEEGFDEGLVGVVAELAGTVDFDSLIDEDDEGADSHCG